MRQPPPSVDGDDRLQRLYRGAAQPELLAWIERNPERARRLTDQEREELLAAQGEGGALNAIGVEQFVKNLERHRTLLERVQAIARTEYLDLLEQFVGLVYEKVHPYPDGA